MLDVIVPSVGKGFQVMELGDDFQRADGPNGGESFGIV